MLLSKRSRGAEQPRGPRASEAAHKRVNICSWRAKKEDLKIDAWSMMFQPHLPAQLGTQ